jgi:hypothetical protein
MLAVMLNCLQEDRFEIGLIINSRVSRQMGDVTWING